MSPTHKILFEYDSIRPDAINRYLAGSLINETHRLTGIVLTYNGATSIHYDLSYEIAPVSGRSRLTAITECAGSGSVDCFPATTIDWQNGVSGWGGTLATGVSAGTGGYVHAMDVNGDGRDDLVWPVTGGDWMILFATGNGFAPSATDTGIAVDWDYQQARVINYDGDNRADLILPHNFYWRILKSTGSGFTAIDTRAPESGAYGGNFLIGDRNGDGRDDMYIGDSYSNICYRINDNSSVFGSPDCISGTSGYTFQGPWANVEIPPQLQDARSDFNGDGRKDWLAFIQNDDGGVDWHTPNITFGSGSSANGHYPITLDFNGDGLSDLIWAKASGSGESVYTMLSTGAGIAGEVSTGVDTIGYDHILVADANADGREDVLIPQGGYYVLLRSTGTTLVNDGSTGVVAPVEADTVRVTDINGDGLDDIVWSASGSWHYRLHQGATPDLLSRITDGLGNTVDVAYGPLSNTTLYTRGTAATYPVRDVSGALQVVASYSVNDGAGGSYSTNYHYEAAQVGVTGRGFLGFGKISATDSRNDVTVETVYKQRWPYIGRPGMVQLERIDGSLLSVTTNTHAMKTFGSVSGHTDRAFPYVASQQKSVYGISGSSAGTEIKTVSTTRTYDNSGNLTDLTVTTGPGEFVTETTVAYAANSTSHCLGLPSEINVTMTSPISGSQTRTTTFGTDTVNCRPTSKIEAPGASLALSSDYTYDSFGNVSEVTLSGAGIGTRTTVTDYGTTGDFPVSVTNALSQTSAATWNRALGRPTSVTDANGLVTAYDYDGFGRRERTTRPDGSGTSWDYQWCDGTCNIPHARYEVAIALTNSGGASGGHGSVFYDRKGRVVGRTRAILGGALSHVTTTYDALGRKSEVTAPYLAGDPVYSTTYTYDVLNRILVKTAPLSEASPTGRRTTHSYDGLTTTVTDPLGHTSSQLINAIGQIVKITDAGGGATSYLYTPFGQLQKVTDAHGNPTTISYNVRGMKTSMTDPDMGHWTYTYDALGELISQTDANGNTITQSYDSLGRLISRTEPQTGGGTGTTQWTYDTAPNGIGKLAVVTAPDGFAKSWTYDTLSRPADITTTIDNTDYTYSRTYDGFSRVATLAYPASYEVTPEPPAIPSAPTFSENPSYDGNFTIHWTKPSGTVTRYVLQQCDSSNFATCLDSDIDIVYEGGGDEGVDIQYEVRDHSSGGFGYSVSACSAASDASCSEYSGVATINVVKYPDTPAAPTIDPNPSTDGNYTVRWTPGGGAPVDLYFLRESVNGGSWHQIFPSGTASTSWSPANAKDNAGYRYEVQGCHYVGGTGYCSAYSDPSATEYVQRKPSRPSSIDANPSVVRSLDSYTVSWSAASRIGHYELRRSVAYIGNWTNLGSVGTARSKTYTAPRVSQTTDYYYEARACNQYGCSDWRGTAMVTVQDVFALLVPTHSAFDGLAILSRPRSIAPQEGADAEMTEVSPLTVSAQVVDIEKQGAEHAAGFRVQSTADARLARATAQAATQPGVYLRYAPPIWLAMRHWHVELAALTTSTTTSGYRFTVSYTYDASGALASVSNAATGKIYWQANGMTARGQVYDASLGNGVTIAKLFDKAVGSISRISAGPDANATAVQQLTYQWSADGDITQRTLTTTDPVTDDQTNHSWTYTYDVLNRLTRSQPSTDGVNGTTLTLTYDEIGNIMSKSDQGLYTYGAGHPHEPVSIGGTGYAYDANGNRVSAGSETYTWTAFNKPVAITDSDSDVTTTFAYAPDRSHYKQTITSSGTTTTIRYVGQRFKTVTSGGVTTYKHQITANGRVIAVYADTDNNTEELGYLHYDANGSLLAVTDMTGTVISRQHYDAYGQAQSMMGDTGDTTNIGFDSHEQLASGLVHMGGRVYDPATGQFTSADPFIQAPFVSKSLNRASFAWNNPLRYVDINGFTASTSAGNGDSCGFIDAVFTNCSGGGGGGGGGGGPSSDWLTSIGSSGFRDTGDSNSAFSGNLNQSASGDVYIPSDSEIDAALRGACGWACGGASVGSTGYPITSAERIAGIRGNLTTFWTLRFDGGNGSPDSYVGAAMWGSPEVKASLGRYWELQADVATKLLEVGMLVNGIIPTDQAVHSFGVDVMHGYINAVDQDYRYNMGNIRGSLDARQFYDAHKPAFDARGIPMGYFGGTPVYGEPWELEVTAPIWCLRCDSNAIPHASSGNGG